MQFSALLLVAISLATGTQAVPRGLREPPPKKGTDGFERRFECIFTGAAGKVDNTRVALGNLNNEAAGRPEKVTMGPGPGHCGQIGCHHRAKIALCNDRTSPLIIHSMDAVNEMVNTLLTECPTATNGGDLFASGQIFHKDGWNIMLQDGNC